MVAVTEPADPIATRIARPGDPDLDCDLTGMTILSVVVADASREILLFAVGGCGTWVDDTTGDLVDVPCVDHAEVTVRLPDMPPDVFAGYVAQLERWRAAATRLRMCSAPGRATLLIENRSTFLPLPRRKDPLT